MCHFKTKGFTLIELLIVIVILMMSVSLVLPLTVEQIDKTKARAEREFVTRLFQESLNDSFFQNRTLYINVKGKQLSIVNGEKQRDWLFNFVSFESKNIEVNSNGYPTTSFVAAIANDKWQLNLHDKEIQWLNID